MRTMAIIAAFICLGILGRASAQEEYTLTVEVQSKSDIADKDAVVRISGDERGSLNNKLYETDPNGRAFIPIAPYGDYAQGFWLYAEGRGGWSGQDSEACHFPNRCGSGSIRHIVLELDSRPVVTPPQPTVQEQCVREVQRPTYIYSDGCGSFYYSQGSVAYASPPSQVSSYCEPCDVWGRPVVGYGYGGSYPSYCPPSYQPGFFGGCFGW